MKYNNSVGGTGIRLIEESKIKRFLACIARGEKMNIALIIAGGSGQRMHQNIPKQFLTVNEKPVIVYTLQDFRIIRI